MGQPRYPHRGDTVSVEGGEQRRSVHRIGWAGGASVARACRYAVVHVFYDVQLFYLYIGIAHHYYKHGPPDDDRVNHVLNHIHQYLHDQFNYDDTAVGDGVHRELL